MRNGVPGSWSNQAKTAVDGSSICDDKASCKILAEDEAVSSWGCAYSECYRARGGNQWNCEPDPLKAKVLNRTNYKYSYQQGPIGCSETCQSNDQTTGNYCGNEWYGTAVNPTSISQIVISGGAGEKATFTHTPINYNRGYTYYLEVGDQFIISGCEATAALEQVYTVTALDPSMMNIVASGTGLGTDRNLNEQCTLTVYNPRIKCRPQQVTEQVLESYSNGCKGPYVCKDDPTLWKSCTLPLQKNGAYDCKNHMDDNDDLVNGGHCNQSAWKYYYAIFSSFSLFIYIPLTNICFFLSVLHFFILFLTIGSGL